MKYVVMDIISYSDKYNLVLITAIFQKSKLQHEFIKVAYNHIPHRQWPYARSV